MPFFSKCKQKFYFNYFFVFVQIEVHYANHSYNLVCSAINEFVVNDVSNLYFTLTKDRLVEMCYCLIICSYRFSMTVIDIVIFTRLFCDKPESERRRAAQICVYYIVETLLQLIAPITPLLVEEVYLYHPVHAGKIGSIQFLMLIEGETQLYVLIISSLRQETVL